MNRIELKNHLQIDNVSGYKTKEKYFKENFYKIYVEINNWSKEYMDISFLERLYLYIENIHSVPKCLTCGNDVVFERNLKKGYRKYCSKKCSNSDPDVIKKIKESNIITQNKVEVKNKIKKTLLNKYGVEHHLQLDEYKEKSKKTNIDKYGVEHHLQLNEFKEKQKKTNVGKYGVEYPIQSEKIKEKQKKTNIKRYGVDNIFKSEKFKIDLKNRQLISFKKRWSTLLNIKCGDIIIKDINNYNVIIKNKCPNHINGFDITKGQLFERHLYQKNKNICTICSPISEQSSIKENEIKNWIKEDLYIKNVIENDRTILNGKELDIYLPDYNLGIEFNGLYWHSELKKSNDYHLNKTNECEKKGIQLIHIFEDEWIYKSDIVKSIIKSKLGLISNKIYGRNTTVKELTVKECRIFLKNNHIQGFVGSKIKLGLYHNNELVSIMTFEKLRKGLGNKDNDPNYYNLNRFCNKLNTQIIGGASKLFKHFIKVYNPSKIVSYADRRWSNGNLYSKLKFEKIHTSKPDYFYFNIKELIRHHRFNFRKNKIVKEIDDINKTEHEIMLMKKYLKIFDSGKIRFEFNKSL